LDQLGSGVPILIRREQLVLLTTPYVEPRTPTERSLAEIWCAFLSLDRVGVEDRYLDLGGDSLTAAFIFAQIEEKFEVRLAMAILESAPTIAQLAPRIDSLLTQPRA
jgi:acyl carrier protein